jgi:glycerophosphoryl diester phosphodiesterase
VRLSSKRALLLAVACIAALSTATQLGSAASPHRHGGAGKHEGGRGPIVIGHRGASGYRPEHTLASYTLAIELGADYIEPDLVSTKDHVLVARHENEIGGTTDVASHPEFTTRKKTKVIDGNSVTGWFTEDFTLAELKTLRARERLPDVRPGNAAFDGLYTIPTLQEVIDLAKRHGVGIYPETKHPTYFDSIGLSLEEPLVRTLEANGWAKKNSPVYIQSFEVANLEQLNGMTKNKLVQLLDATGKPYDFVVAGDPRTYADLATAAGLEEIAGYADGVGPNKSLLIPRDANNMLGAPTTFVEDAHHAGLVVHPWTFRRENTFLPKDYQQGNPASPEFARAMGDAPGEFGRFMRLGIDGLFSDNPDLAVATRETIFG